MAGVGEGDKCVSMFYLEPLEKGYMPKTAKIRFIVYWQKEGSEYEVRIVLPELYFERTDRI